MKTLIYYLSLGIILTALYPSIAYSFDEEKEEKFWSPIRPYRLKTKTIIPKTFELGIKGEYFQTSGYYDQDGTSTPLQDENSYSRIDLEAEVGYGFGEKFEMTGGFKYRKHSSTVGLNDYSGSGAESVFVSGKYRVDLSEAFTFSSLLTFRQKIYENDPETSGAGMDQMILGNDGHEMTLSGLLSYERTKTHAFTAGIGYRSFSAQVSSELPWLLETSWSMESLALILGVRGTFSMSEEEEGATKTAFNQGATTLYNGVNPSYTEPYLGINFLMGRTRLSFDLSQRTMGTSTDQGMTISAGLTWSSSNEEEKEKIKIASFKEYTVEAHVIKISPRGLFLKVDKGVSSEVEKGESADIYLTNYLGGNVLLATGIVYDTGVNWAIIKITKKYKNIKIKKGNIVRFK